VNSNCSGYGELGLNSQLRAGHAMSEAVFKKKQQEYLQQLQKNK